MDAMVAMESSDFLSWALGAFVSVCTIGIAGALICSLIDWYRDSF